MRMVVVFKHVFQNDKGAIMSQEREDQNMAQEIALVLVIGGVETL